MSIEIIHLVATAFMAGVIVFVQVVHYPLMGRVGSESFPSYQAGHVVRTGFVVVPAMLVELASAVWIVVGASGGAAWNTALLGLALLGVIWVSTALLQAPAHGRLEQAFDVDVHTGLVRWNWIRTVAWIARVPVAVFLVVG